VINLAAKVRQWWKGEAKSSLSQVPFAVQCVCNQTVTGLRRPVHQVVRCDHCAAPVFILPASPLPAVRRRKAKRPEGPAVGGKRWRTWLIVGAVALPLLAALALVWWSGRLSPGTDPPGETAAESVGSHLKAAHDALSEGNFLSALREFDLARKLPGWQALPAARRRELAQLRRQAGLLADLSETSLQEILRQSRETTSPEEWDLVFAKRYRGKAFVLDAEASRNPSGKYVIEHILRVGAHEGRVQIDDLDLVRRLARGGRLDHPVRLVLGARLAGIGRGSGGTWVIRLQPDSGVLLTDWDCLLGACPALDGDSDPELRKVLERQSAWLAELP
jgi:hypothetical protein